MVKVTRSREALEGDLSTCSERVGSVNSEKV